MLRVPSPVDPAGLSPPARVPAALVPLGAAIALAVGLAAGNPTPETLVPGALIAGAAAVLLSLARPFAAFLVLAASTIFLVAVSLPGNHGLNAFDLLLPPATLASIVGMTRSKALASDRRASDPRHRELHAATRRLIRAVVVFYGIAAVSVVLMALSGRTGPVPNSVICLARAVQGLLLFPLGLWWLRTERRIHLTINAMLVGGVLFAVLNSITVGIYGVKRAALTWYVNEGAAPMRGPNEAGVAMLLLIVLLLVRQSLTHRVLNLALIGLALSMLVMTASRSSLLASLVVAALVLPRARWRWIVFAVLVAIAAIPLVPDAYWTRIGRTVTLERGTFEAYTSLIRVYSWKAALAVFLDHPLLGVGYLGFSSVSGRYGDLAIVLGPAENYYLETAAGMGIPGLIALGLAIFQLYRLGSVVRRHASAGSLGQTMARFHTPLLLALLVVNLTGDVFIGMVTLGQLALWSAMLVRAGHLSLDTEPSAASPASER